MAKPERTTVKSHCNECLAQTNHDVLASCKRDWTEEHDGQVYLVERMVYELVRCRGCENVGLRRTYSLGSNPDEVDYFPPAVSRRRPNWPMDLAWFLETPRSDINDLFQEVYSAIYSGNNRLALMGTRAIIDVALTDKLGDVGGFQQKLKAAKNKGWITEIQHKTLDAAIDAGNAASHRAYKPDTEQLNLVLDIVEHLIQMLYVLEKNAGKITKKTPSRKKTP